MPGFARDTRLPTPFAQFLLSCTGFIRYLLSIVHAFGFIKALPGRISCVCGRSRVCSSLHVLFPWIVLACLVGCFFRLQVINFTPAYMESDPDGYLVLAKRIARGEALAFQPPNPFQYHSHVWVENEQGLVTSKFAPGYPLVMAVFFLLLGDEGMFWVSPVMAALSLVGAFFLFRQWMSATASLLAVFTISINWYVLFYGGFLLTHATNLCLTTWGMCALWSWWRKPAVARGLAAGLLLGGACAVRYSSGVFGLAILIAALSVLLRQRRQWQRGDLLRSVVPLLPYAIVLVLLAIYNQWLFGSPLTTGYKLSGEQGAFSFAFLVQNIFMLIKGLDSRFLPVLMPVALMGLLLVGKPTERFLRLAWLVPVVLVYGSYYWAKTGNPYLRFFICTIPLFVGSAYALIQAIPASAWLRHLAMLLMTGWCLAESWPQLDAAREGRLFRQHERDLAGHIRTVAESIDQNSVIFTHKPFVDYLATRERFDLYNLKAFTRHYGARTFRPWPRDGGNPVDAYPLRHLQRIERLLAFYQETPQDSLREMKQAIASNAMEQGRQVVLVVPVSSLNAEVEDLIPGRDAKLLAGFEMSSRWRGRGAGKWGVFQLE